MTDTTAPRFTCDACGATFDDGIDAGAHTHLTHGCATCATVRTFTDGRCDTCGTDGTGPTLITDAELDALNAARLALRAIMQRYMDTYQAGERHAMVYAMSDAALDTLATVVNYARSWGHQAISDDAMYLTDDYAAELRERWSL